jgi:hypothetical protein
MRLAGAAGCAGRKAANGFENIRFENHPQWIRFHPTHWGLSSR